MRIRIHPAVLVELRGFIGFVSLMRYPEKHLVLRFEDSSPDLSLAPFRSAGGSLCRV